MVTPTVTEVVPPAPRTCEDCGRRFTPNPLAKGGKWLHKCVSCVLGEVV